MSAVIKTAHPPRPRPTVSMRYNRDEGVLQCPVTQGEFITVEAFTGLKPGAMSTTNSGYVSMLTTDDLRAFADAIDAARERI